nr:hypothetical protein [Actinomycetota bacterium]
GPPQGEESTEGSKRRTTPGTAPPPSGAVPGAGASVAQGPPAQTVVRFYQLAAAERFDEAWALLTPRARRQVGGFDSWSSSQRSVESIAFQRARTTSQTASGAEVEFRDVATHTGFVDRCRGGASLVPGGQSGWLIDSFDGISCRRSSGPGAGSGGGRKG